MTKSFLLGTEKHTVDVINLYNKNIRLKTQTDPNLFYQAFHHILLISEYLSHSTNVEIPLEIKKQFKKLRHGISRYSAILQNGLQPTQVRQIKTCDGSIISKNIRI